MSELGQVLQDEELARRLQEEEEELLRGVRTSPFGLHDYFFKGSLGRIHLTTFPSKACIGMYNDLFWVLKLVHLHKLFCLNGLIRTVY